MGSKKLIKRPERATKDGNSGGVRYKGVGLGRFDDAKRRALVYPQADNIIDKFGGAYQLCRAVNYILPEGEKPWAPSTVYRWTYPKGFHYGTGGEIPVRKLKTILKAARYDGVVIVLEDLYPKLFRDDREALADILD